VASAIDVASLRQPMVLVVVVVVGLAAVQVGDSHLHSLESQPLLGSNLFQSTPLLTLRQLNPQTASETCYRPNPQS
jgi:hypothetical protein